MIDTHAHLDFESFDTDREEVVERFFGLGGRAIVNMGVDQARIAKTLEISARHPKIFSAIGFHPEETGKVIVSRAIEILEENLADSKLVAIGEIGLDYFHNKKNKKEQKELFLTQLELAREKSLPAVLHCREAYDDLLEILNRAEFENLPAVLHCYMGDSNQTDEFLKLENLMFSFTGNITFNSWERFQVGNLTPEKAETFKVVQAIPIERIMAETDCPFLAPQSHRGERNEPSFVKEVIRQIAKIKSLTPEKAEKITDQNAERFFEIQQ